MRLAPEVGGDGAAGGGGDEDDVAGLGARRLDALPEVAAGERVGLGAARLDQREAAQAGVEVFAPDAVARLALAVAQADFGALLDEVRDERGGLGHGALEAQERLRAVLDEGVEDDVDAALVLGRELAHDEAALARGRLPVDVAHVVVRLVLAQGVQVVPRAAPLRFELAGVDGQQVQLVAQALGLRVDDDLHVARAQAAAQAEEAEREARRDFKARDEHAAARGEGLLDALLDLGAVRQVHEVGEGALALARAAEEAARLRVRLGALARLDRDGERGQQPLRVVDGDDDGRRFAREDVVGEARGDGQLAQGDAPRRQRDEERRGEDGEDEEEEVVARVPRGEGDDRVEADEDDAAARHLEREVEPRRLRPRVLGQRRHDEDHDEHGERDGGYRAQTRQLPVAAPPRQHRQRRRAHAAQHDQRPENRVTPTLHSEGEGVGWCWVLGQSCCFSPNTQHPTPSPFILPAQSGTLTVFMISRKTSSASSLRRWSEEEKRELTTRRCAKTGRTSLFTSSGTQ